VSIWQEIGEAIAAQTGRSAAHAAPQPVGGGCINRAFRVRYGSRDYFVKINAARHLDMFEAEALGLREILASATLRVPGPVCWGCADDSSYLVLEYLELGGGGSAAALGAGLARMHRVTQPRYGWWRDNTIGSTPQVNGESDDWAGFWRDRRIGFQLALAAKNGNHGRLQREGERLLAEMPGYFACYRPGASLLHGDLWSGNYAFGDGGEPVIFDPAVYYGDRETDIAMTELFGGFEPAFYAAYREAYPLEDGYAVRRLLYNLYHVLNHLNLFGGGYRAQAEAMIGRLLSEVR
jgi:protein-ribulosamine 3-kinase